MKTGKLSLVVLRIMVLTAILLPMGACRHKELDDDPEPKVRLRVVYDWKNAPEGEERAKAMAVFFYSREDGRSYRFDFQGNRGGVVELPQGVWDIVTYNTDTPGVLFGNTHSYYNHEAYTRLGHPLEGALGNSIAHAPRANEEEDVVITPDELWGIANESQPIYADPATGEAVVTLYPDPLVCYYTYEIRNVKNIEHISKACGTLSGMSGRLTFHEQSLHRTMVTLPFASDTDTEGGKITGEFFTFGHHEANPDPHIMNLYVWMDDGRKLAYGTTRADKWDVTDQVHSAPDRRRVHIIIDGLDIPQLITGGGFNPSADDWGEEEIEVEVPL